MVDRRSSPRKKTARAALVEVGARPPAARGTIRLFFMLGVLVLVNLYVFVWRDGTSIGDVRAKAQNIGSAPIDSGPKPPPLPVAAPVVTGPRTVEGVVAKGESLGKILVVSKTVTVRVARDAAGVLGGVKDQAATRIELQEVGGRIDSSLYGAVKAAGEDGALVSFFVDVFAYDIDFYNDTRQGDTFKVIVEKEYKDQEFLRYRRIVAAEYSGNAGTFHAFYWQPSDKPGRHFDEQGQSVEKSMLKSPLKFARVSSNFNPRRMHPVLHKVKGHFGTDFACPVGTPVWAAADGVISQIGPNKGAGNMITIRHDNGLVSIYMHLSKFTAGLKVGSRVAAKTVIAQSGNTGLSTGPHLHFAVKQNGSWVDFMKLKPARAAGVPKAQLGAFREQIAKVADQLAKIPTAVATPVAVAP